MNDANTEGLPETNDPVESAGSSSFSADSLRVNPMLERRMVGVAPALLELFDTKIHDGNFQVVFKRPEIIASEFPDAPVRAFAHKMQLMTLAVNETRNVRQPYYENQYDDRVASIQQKFGHIFSDWPYPLVRYMLLDPKWDVVDDYGFAMLSTRWGLSYTIDPQSGMTNVHTIRPGIRLSRRVFDQEAPVPSDKYDDSPTDQLDRRLDHAHRMFSP